MLLRNVTKNSNFADLEDDKAKFLPVVSLRVTETDQNLLPCHTLSQGSLEDDCRGTLTDAGGRRTRELTKNFGFDLAKRLMTRTAGRLHALKTLVYTLPSIAGTPLFVMKR